MNADTNPFTIPIRDFVGSRQATLFQTLKQPQFSGELILKSTKSQEWTFYLYLGRIVYATGGIHPLRRWQRNLTAYAPHLVLKLDSLEEQLNNELVFQVCWEYDLLNFWLEKQEISRKQLVQIIRSIIVEILFDLTQAMEITFQLKVSQSLSSHLVLLDTEQVIVEAWRLWQDWQGAKLADRSPNTSPIIRQEEELSKRTSPKTYQLMSKLFNGQNTLRDLAIQLNQDLVQMTSLMTPYFQLGLIELIEIPDLSLSWGQSELAPTQLELTPTEAISPVEISPLTTEKAVVVCVDHSFSVTEQMKQIVTSNGYKFLSFNDINLALASLSVNKSDFVFLDLHMPNVNIYQACYRLRQLSSFHKMPIVMMSENLAITDKVLAKMVGCCDFLSKPLNSQAVLAMIGKHLKTPS